MSDDEEFDHREEVVQTERGFTLSINHKRGTAVRDEDTVNVDWKLDRLPPEDALAGLAQDVVETMESLRKANEVDDD